MTRGISEYFFFVGFNSAAGKGRGLYSRVPITIGNCSKNRQFGGCFGRMGRELKTRNNPFKPGGFDDISLNP
jgi:hypothetical protein